MPNSIAKKFPPNYWSWLQEHPDDVVSAIVRVDTLSSEVEVAITEAGCRVMRRLQLLPAFAVEVTAKTLLELAKHPWVQRIEPDKPVQML
jgi:hypothetical protein